MSAIENILGMLPDRVGDGKNSQIYTPPHIAKEMVNTLPEDIWNKDTTFLDICCKSGIFLYKIYQKLMESPSMVESFPDETDRATHIIHKQLFGIAPSIFCQMFSTRTVYGYLDPDSHIVSINEYELVMRNADKTFLYKTLQKEFNMKKFGVVIGNPPYNNDAYLDFVDKGHKLADKYTMMITPAKWQAKGGAKNEAFRKNIMPYMEKIIYYPYTNDVFDVTSQGGISIIGITKELHVSKQLHIKKKHDKVFINEEDTELTSDRLTLYDERIEQITKKVSFGKRLKMQSLGIVSNLVNVKITNVLSGDVNQLNCCGGMVLTEAYIDNCVNNKNSHTSCIKNCKTQEEAKSFISYLNTKFVRFLVGLASHTVAIINDETWRFVPAPEAFDHIFTDAELYEKYNLTQEEINIIESVIKERK